MKRSIFISSLNAAHLAIGSSEFRIAIFVLQVYDASFGSLRKLPKTYMRTYVQDNSNHLSTYSDRTVEVQTMQLVL